MVHVDEITWDSLTARMASIGGPVLNALTDGRAANRWWTAFKDGRSDADIATALGGGATASKVAQATSFFVALKDTYDFINDVASPAQGDRLADWRKFVTGR